MRLAVRKHCKGAGGSKCNCSQCQQRSEGSRVLMLTCGFAMTRLKLSLKLGESITVQGQLKTPSETQKDLYPPIAWQQGITVAVEKKPSIAGKDGGPITLNSAQCETQTVFRKATENSRFNCSWRIQKEGKSDRSFSFLHRARNASLYVANSCLVQRRTLALADH